MGAGRGPHRFATAAGPMRIMGYGGRESPDDRRHRETVEHMSEPPRSHPSE